MSAQVILLYFVLLATGGQGVRADSCNPGDIFAGRRICFPCTAGYMADHRLLELQKLGDSCRRLLCSHGVMVQVSVCERTPRDASCDCARMVKCLAPHLCRMLVFATKPSNGFRLQHMLPAAAQLERACIDMDQSYPDDVSMLGQFYMLKELHINVRTWSS